MSNLCSCKSLFFKQTLAYANDILLTKKVCEQTQFGLNMIYSFTRWHSLCFVMTLHKILFIKILLLVLGRHFGIFDEF